MTEIRPIAPGDHDAWRALFRDYGEFYETRFTDEVLDGVWGWLMQPGHDVHALVADDAGTVVGFAHIRRVNDTFTAGPAWFLDDLYVSPDHRGTGVARALIERGYADATAAGGGTFRWITASDNETAQLLYDRISTRAGWLVYEKEL